MGVGWCPYGAVSHHPSIFLYLQSHVECVVKFGSTLHQSLFHLFLHSTAASAGNGTFHRFVTTLYFFRPPLGIMPLSQRTTDDGARIRSRNIIEENDSTGNPFHCLMLENVRAITLDFQHIPNLVRESISDITLNTCSMVFRMQTVKLSLRGCKSKWAVLSTFFARARLFMLQLPLDRSIQLMAPRPPQSTGCDAVPQSSDRYRTPKRFILLPASSFADNNDDDGDDRQTREKCPRLFLQASHTLLIFRQAIMVPCIVRNSRIDDTKG